jgi:hypothetical protein
VSPVCDDCAVLMAQVFTPAVDVVQHIEARGLLGSIGHGILVFLLIIFFIGLVLGLAIGFFLGRITSRNRRY